MTSLSFPLAKFQISNNCFQAMVSMQPHETGPSKTYLDAPFSDLVGSLLRLRPFQRSSQRSAACELEICQQAPFTIRSRTGDLQKTHFEFSCLSEHRRSWSCRHKCKNLGPCGLGDERRWARQPVTRSGVLCLEYACLTCSSGRDSVCSNAECFENRSVQRTSHFIRV